MVVVIFMTGPSLNRLTLTRNPKFCCNGRTTSNLTLILAWSATLTLTLTLTKVYAPAGRLRAPTVEAMWNGREDAEARCAEIERKYTPTTSDDDLGFVDLVVKLYAGSQLERFPVRVRVRVWVRASMHVEA